MDDQNHLAELQRLLQQDNISDEVKDQILRVLAEKLGTPAAAGGGNNPHGYPGGAQYVPRSAVQQFRRRQGYAGAGPQMQASHMLAHSGGGGNFASNLLMLDGEFNQAIRDNYDYLNVPFFGHEGALRAFMDTTHPNNLNSHPAGSDGAYAAVDAPEQMVTMMMDLAVQHWRHMGIEFIGTEGIVDPNSPAVRDGTVVLDDRGLPVSGLASLFRRNKEWLDQQAPTPDDQLFAAMDASVFGTGYRPHGANAPDAALFAEFEQSIGGAAAARGFVPSAAEASSGLTSADLHDFHDLDTITRREHQGVVSNLWQSVLPGLVVPGAPVTPQQMAIMQNPSLLAMNRRGMQAARAQQQRARAQSREDARRRENARLRAHQEQKRARGTSTGCPREGGKMDRGNGYGCMDAYGVLCTNACGACRERRRKSRGRR